MDASDTTYSKKALAYFCVKIDEFIAQNIPNVGQLKEVRTPCVDPTKYLLTFPTYELRKLFFDGRRIYLNCSGTC